MAANAASTVAVLRRAGSDPGPTIVRWMAVWITIGILVVAVVIGFLLGIVSALESVDANLAVAREAVTGAGGDVQPLPVHLENVSTTLDQVDSSLEPIPGQAGQIVAALASVNERLAAIDASLGDTSGSLTDTSDVLAGILDLAGQVEATLEVAQQADSLGTSGIWLRVATANDPLAAARDDTGNIITSLTEVNEHLTSICQALPGESQC